MVKQSLKTLKSQKRRHTNPRPLTMAQNQLAMNQFRLPKYPQHQVRDNKRKSGKVLENEKFLDKSYIQGPAAFGSVKNLQKQTKLPLKTVKSFLASQNAHTKYLNAVKKFPRLKVIAYRINEIWSMDVAYVDKLAKYNKNYKYLLVAVDVLSRYLRVVPLKNKSAEEAARAFKQMIRVKKPEKVWTDKGTEFKGAFKQLCEKHQIHTYSTQSETKSAFAERNIRSLKTIIYKYLEKNWTWEYIHKLDDFVKTINSRVNRMTGLAPNKVFKKHEPYLVSLANEASAKLVRKPKFSIGEKVRIAKKDLPFKKGYQQNFTDEIFEIVKIPTVNPPTYHLVDDAGEVIQGKFYERELVQVQKNE